ncbi:MAG TPA: hypothetical protein PKD60_14030, partial [Turneriella sp.]|nr:hypothetical protein [Turneriella sp.]
MRSSVFGGVPGSLAGLSVAGAVKVALSGFEGAAVSVFALSSAAFFTGLTFTDGSTSSGGSGFVF